MKSTDAPDLQGTDRFSIVRCIGAGGMGVVYEAHDLERDAKVALKTLRTMDAQALYRFKNEFRSLAAVVHPNLVSLYELFSNGNSWFFTMELIDGAVPFLDYLRGSALGSTGQELGTCERLQQAGGDVEFGAGSSSSDTPSHSDPVEPSEEGDMTVDQDGARFLVTRAPFAEPPRVEPRRNAGIDFDRLRAVFRQLAEGVSALHRAGKLHRDLKPQNVLVRPNGQVVILDFGLIAELGSTEPTQARKKAKTESTSPGSPPESYYSRDDHIVGTVAYMAPEQAAAQPVTAACDWYAVGVMLFQAITGRLPIMGDTADVLRNKQKFDAKAPAELILDVPEDLNQLCVDLLQRTSSARPTGDDILARLGGQSVLPQQGAFATVRTLPFIGREKHLAVLNDAFARMLQGKTAVYHVHGKSGAGKSALVQRFLDDVAERMPAVILGGKCYEQESVPFKGVDSLVDALTRYLMRLPEADQDRLIPRDIAPLARIFPVLKRVPQVAHAVEKAAGHQNLVELRNLAFASFRELLGRIGADLPLILHIDDLQWGDLDSARLLSILLEPPRAPRLLLLACYRSEYQQSSTCLQTLRETQRAGEATQEWGELAVDPLSLEETHQLAVQLLGDDSPAGHDKADWVVRESRGTVFFAYELVRHLQAGQTLAAAEGVDLDEVLWMRVQRLPEDARRVLELVAVAGQPVPLRNIQEAAELAALPPQVLTSLRSDHLVRSTGPTLSDEVEAYHDRISESVVSHLAAATLEGHHLRLAQSLEETGKTDPETLATQFHRGRRLDKARHYYELAADEAVQALAFERAEDFHRQAAQLAEAIQDKARIHEKMIHFYTDLARFADAYAIGRQGAQLFGIRLPTRFIGPLFLIDLLIVRWRLRRRPIAGLVDLPAMTDEHRATALRLLVAVGKAAYQVDPRLNIAGQVKAVNLCLKHGNTPESALSYMAFGAIFEGGVMGNHQKGYDFGKLALALIDKHNNERLRSEISFVVGYFATSWLRPAAEAEQLWQTAYEEGIRVGDLFHTGCACSATTMSLFMRGAPMQDILARSEQYLEFLNRAQLREPIGAITAVRQAIRNLRGLTRSRDSLSDNTFDEEAYRTKLAGFGSRHLAHYYFVAKMQTLYLWREYDQALTVAGNSAAYLKDSPGMLHSAEHHFYHALILAAHYPKCGFFQRWRRRRALRKIHKTMRRWAANCPDNFLHKEQLVAAEICRAVGKEKTALEHYQAAIAAAAKYGYGHIEALAHERAARFHQSRGDLAAGTAELAAARTCYRRWGANSYAAALPES